MGHATGNQFIVQNKWLRHMCRPIHSGLRQSLSYCRQAFDVQSTARVLFSGAEADNAIFWCLFISTAIVIVVIATVVVTVLFCWPSVVTNERGCHLRSLSSVDCRIMKYQFVALVEWYWWSKTDILRLKTCVDTLSSTYTTWISLELNPFFCQEAGNPPPKPWHGLCMFISYQNAGHYCDMTACPKQNMHGRYYYCLLLSPSKYSCLGSNVGWAYGGTNSSWTMLS